MASKGKKLDNGTKLKCPWCDKESTAEEWNAKTYEACTNREMRRTYTKLDNTKVFDRKKQVYYICPKCSTCSSIHSLKIVDTDDTELLKLGGYPVIRDNSTITVKTV